ncbi:hypothetical protein ACWDY4_11070 [Streptomyces olivaceoviridis]
MRSVRESDLELLRQFTMPTLAYSGAQRALPRRARQSHAVHRDDRLRAG